MDTALRAIIGKINKDHGTDTIITGDRLAKKVISRITSGSLALDVALGGGWPVNQWNEIVGEESAGKSATILMTVAANQAKDKAWTCVWVAAEEFVPSYAEMLGCDLKRIIVVDMNGMESAFTAVMKFMETKLVDAVVIDSLPALVPEREELGEMGEIPVGLGAWLTGQFFRKQGTAAKRSLTEAERPVTGFVVNQWRDQIGVKYGDPRTTPGGKAKNYWFFTRVEVRRDEWIVDGKDDGVDRRVGQTIKARIFKNKTTRPHQVGVYDYYFADGPGDLKAGSYDLLKECINLGVRYEVIERKGAWYHFGGQQWNGRAELLLGIREDPALSERIKAEVLDVAVKGKVKPPQEPGDADDEGSTDDGVDVEAPARKVAPRRAAAQKRKVTRKSS